MLNVARRTTGLEYRICIGLLVFISCAPNSALHHRSESTTARADDLRYLYTQALCPPFRCVWCPSAFREIVFHRPGYTCTRTYVPWGPLAAPTVSAVPRWACRCIFAPHPRHTQNIAAASRYTVHCCLFICSYSAFVPLSARPNRSGSSFRARDWEQEPQPAPAVTVDSCAPRAARAAAPEAGSLDFVGVCR
jgi:hypothetical protein